MASQTTDRERLPGIGYNLANDIIGERGSDYGFGRPMPWRCRLFECSAKNDLVFEQPRFLQRRGIDPGIYIKIYINKTLRQ